MPSKAILCMVRTNPHDHVFYKLRMRELRALAEVAGYTPVDTMIQTRLKPTTSYCFGKGKAQELREKVEAHKADTVIFYNTLSSKQKLNLERLLYPARVIDRVELTLEIFQLSSADVFSALQIMLAFKKKVFPYLKLEAARRYFRHRAGFRGGGEYAYMSRVRGLHKEIKALERKIEKYRRMRADQVRKKLENGAWIVCITGYYNAGKTTLFNLLTGLSMPVSDQPFTTLSSKYGRLLDESREIYLVDTIGFVLDLDPELILSFKLNVDDMKAAHILLFMLDISEPPLLLKTKLEQGLALLTEKIGIPEEKIVIVLNKTDLISPEQADLMLKEIAEAADGIPVCRTSAASGEVSELLATLRDLMEKLKTPQQKVVKAKTALKLGLIRRPPPS